MPENIVGHPLVPDSLRAKLGLYTNDLRAMRDSFIFAEATRCRAPGAVRVHMHQIAADNSAMKPSRILFNGISDEDLPSLAMRLYAVTEGGEGAPDRKLPKAWRLDLPVPPKGTIWRDKISATLLDGYRRCPFEFFLDETFKKHSDDRNSELDSAAFGSLCHAALDDFAKSAFKDSCSEKEIGDFLEGAVQRRLVAFGDVLPVVIGLQGEAAIARLRSFARIQAARRKSGWRIIAAERPLHCRIKDCPTLITGKVDRIDEHETTGELAIIDYKTWPRINEKHLAGIQLPLYRAMVEASKKFPPERARRAKAFYCVLADRPEDTVFADGEGFVRHEGTQPDDENAIALLLERLAKGVFYPPGKDSYWRDKFGAIVWETPEEGICEEWLADQKRRLEQ